jgi:gliding motility-associated-like protein
MIFTLGVKAQAPVADFSANTVAGCGPLSVAFHDNSTGNPTAWTWDLGNGQISSSQNPSTVYSNPGTYSITLIVKNSSGASSVKKTDYITVYPYPTTNFKANLNLACAPATVQFIDLSTPGQGSITQWAWNFGDGNTSGVPNPVNTYTQPGYYNVSLKVTNSQGCSNSASGTRFIRLVQGVQADFAYSQTSNSCNAPFNITFNNQTSGPGNLSFNWDLGNGNLSNAANPSTTYPSSIGYTVNLTATSDLGCSQTIKKTITFPAINPAITAPDSACVGGSVLFQNGSQPAPQISTWTFGDGSGYVLPNPLHSYAAAGNYTVQVVNTYPTCIDSVTRNIKIINSPIADFSATKTVTCKAPFTVNFQDQSTSGANTYQWDFGDGTVSTLQNPSHTYNTSGDFTVKLTVTDAVGCSGTVTKTKFISIAGPTVTMTNAPAGGCTGPGGFNFNPALNISSVDGIASYSWTATGATPSTSTSATPSFNYAAIGSYDIKLTLTTTDGCSTTTTFPGAVSIGNPTKPLITVIPATTEFCPHSLITFTSPSTPADQWTWKFGDGSSAKDSATVHHMYSDTGYQTITLTVENNGCAQTDSVSGLVHVNAPIAAFAYTTDCKNKYLVNFRDSSVLDPSKPITYEWDYGDGSNSGVLPGPIAPVSHIYAISDTSYSVSLTVTNGSCTDMYVQTISLAQLKATFTTPKARVCKQELFTLFATITDTKLTASYLWQVGAGTPYVAADGAFTDQLLDTGTYSLSLIIKDVNNCLDTSATSYIQVTGPSAKFIPAGKGACKNGPVIFTDQSVPYNSNFPIVQHNWNFGDGTIVSQPGPVYSHAYADTGFYRVTLTVQDDSGCKDTYQYNDSVQITSPIVNFFAADTFYCPNEPLPFTFASIGYNLTALWNFGDGGTSTDIFPVHNFAYSPQKYSITLTVTDQAGCVDSFTRSNYIRIQPPIAAFTLQDSTTICPPLQTTFIPNGQYYDSLYWDFGDGSTSTLPNTTHFYNSYDTFYAKLILRGPGGCLDSATKRVFVLDPNATTQFSYSPLKACDSISTDFIVIPPGFTKRTLAFGDGKEDSSSLTALTHFYKGPGTYGPQITLTDPTGCIVGFSGPSVITILGATPFFTMDKHSFCDSGRVNFTDVTITNDSIVSKTWDFGDGTTSTQPDPSHYYTTDGKLLVTLAVQTKDNCAENYVDTVMVWQTPHPSFTVVNAFCATGPLQFQGSLLVPEVDSVVWAWNFGDGQGSALQNPQNTYARPGNYTVSLKTSVAYGCSDTTSQTFTIYPLPAIKGPAQITTPVGFPIALPMTYSSNIMAWSWTPSSDLSCADCPNPLASPIFRTEYTVTVTDSNNCVSKDSIEVVTICNSNNYFLPNTFSPNGDGVNDVFYPRGRSLYNIRSMRVFNRWGQMVFERRDFPANSASDGWDGTFNGRPSPVDVYVYMVEVVCDNAQVVALNGNVTLIR